MPFSNDAFQHRPDAHGLARSWFRTTTLSPDFLYIGNHSPYEWSNGEQLDDAILDIEDDHTCEALLEEIALRRAAGTNDQPQFHLDPDMRFTDDYFPSIQELHFTGVVTADPAPASKINGKCYTPHAPLGVDPIVQRMNPFFANARINVLPDLSVHDLYFHSGTHWTDEEFRNFALHIFISNGPSSSFDLLKRDNLNRYVYNRSEHLTPNGTCIQIHPNFRPRAPIRPDPNETVGTYEEDIALCTQLHSVWISDAPAVEKRQLWNQHVGYLLNMEAILCTACEVVVPRGFVRPAQSNSNRTHRLCRFCADNLELRGASIQSQASTLHLSKERRECSICNASKLYLEYSNRQYYKGNNTRVCLDCQGNQ